jgi:hypothetical protein
MKLWKGKLPNRPPEELARELYEAENKGKAEPSGSQDMIGLVYPGVNRLDYDFKIHGGVFPSHNETMLCWEKILPHVVAHPLIKLDLVRILRIYQKQFPGAMFSGCGGGYLIVASENRVPGAFQVTVRLAK